MTYFINSDNVSKITVTVSKDSCNIILDVDSVDGTTEEVFTLSSGRVDIIEHEDFILIETE